MKATLGLRSKQLLKALLGRSISLVAGSRLQVERHGVRFELDPDDEIQLGILLGLYERDARAILSDYLGVGGRAIDVGANVGFWSLQMARLVGSSGEVVACEADPVLAARVARNSALNGFEDRLDVVAEAVSASPGTVAFHQTDPGRNSGWGSVEHFPDIDSERIEVPATTLDRLVSERGWERVDFVKVDVEGHEPSVLGGAATLLAEGRVGALLVEINEPRLREVGSSGREIAATLSRHGYEPTTPLERGASACYNLLFERGPDAGRGSS